MSNVNYRLELPTQWSIHPVFHIDLLTPYKETIMHGPNYTRPTPELVDGEEEYYRGENSRLPAFRQKTATCNIWSNGKDTQTRTTCGSIKMTSLQMIRCGSSKLPTPTQVTHIRSTSVAKSPHPPTSCSLSITSHQHALSYMSSDGNNDLADEYPAGAIADSPIPHSQEFPINTPVRVQVPIPVVDFTTLQPLAIDAPVFVPRPVTASSSASDVAAMFRQLRVHTPAPLTPDGQRAADQAAETFAVSFTPAERRGDQAGPELEQGTATRPDGGFGSYADNAASTQD
jgi:hypothetical protein